jgi:hypothetical protein
MKSLEYDLRYLASGTEILEKYLFSDEVFWPINVSPPEGEPAYPRLTLDGLLLVRTRLMGRSKSPDQQARMEQVISMIEFNRSKWRVAWEGKAGKCYQVRLRMWQNFIQEYQENPHENADRYPYEVRLRVMLELLKAEFKYHSRGEIDLLLGLDGYLKSILVHGGFIWDIEIQAGFPEKEYWFLYGKIPTIITVH